MKWHVCPRRGTLRAWRDEELDAAQAERVAAHVSRCETCSKRLADMDMARAVVSASLADHGADAQSQASDSSLEALLHAAYADRTKGKVIMRNRVMRDWGVWRPAAVAALIVALLVGSYSFAPTRMLASDLLGVFRVRKFAVIRLDPSQVSQFESIAEQLEQTLLVEEPEILVDEDMVQVADITEARERAGFDVLMPKDTAEQVVEDYYVRGQLALGMETTRQSLVTLLELAGMDADKVPESFEGGDVQAGFAAAVQFGTVSWDLVQVWQPRAEYPTGFDPALVGEAGFRLMGIPEREARRLAKSIDWTSTLIVPVPTDVLEVTEIEIDGRPGLLMAPANRYQAEGGEAAVLIWERDGILYALSSDLLSNRQMVSIAESLFD